MSRASGRLVDRLWITRPQLGAATRHLGVKKVALLVRPEGLSSLASGFAIRVSHCRSPRWTRNTRNDIDF